MIMIITVLILKLITIHQHHHNHHITVNGGADGKLRLASKLITIHEHHEYDGEAYADYEHDCDDDYNDYDAYNHKR